MARVFREGWVPPDGGKRPLPMAIEAVGGARPGDPRPPLQPDAYVNHVTNAEVIMVGQGRSYGWRSCFPTGTFTALVSGTGRPITPTSLDRMRPE
jgi:hypothetical protein